MVTKKPAHRLHNAHYHAVKATARWAEFMAGLTGEATRTVEHRARREAQRKRETTYARDELGGS